MFRILRGLGSRALPCGCLVGLYETYANTTIAILDAKGPECADRAHQVDARIDAAGIDPPAQPPSTIPTMNR